MRIEQIKLTNFRIYTGENKISFKHVEDKNISLIAGKNGFGKTTFLTSLIWALYGGLMTQVEEKYKRDVKTAGGYEKFLRTLISKSVLEDFKTENIVNPTLEVEVLLADVLIPSIPCKAVTIRRSYNYRTNKEKLEILIDGLENQLTKEVGYEVFINDFILPREIAKFFFFDAEKIVTLAEAKSKEELRTLSKAYSEVLGIKKYEDLKLNLNTLLTKLKRSGVSKVDKGELDLLVGHEFEYEKLIGINDQKQHDIESDITVLKSRMDNIQEELIREGNAMTLEQLKELKNERDNLNKIHIDSKSELKSLFEIVPLVIAGKSLARLIKQIKSESLIRGESSSSKELFKELQRFSKDLKAEVVKLKLETKAASKVKEAVDKLIRGREVKESNQGKIILDLTEETSREILAIYSYIKDSFSTNFQAIVRQEKDVRLRLSRIKNKIKLGEVRQNNPLAKKLREDKQALDEKVDALLLEKNVILEETAVLKLKRNSNTKVLSEYEKNFKLVATDKKKYEVTVQLLEKLQVLMARIKDEKKYSLQKSVLLGLKRLMHKDDFISDVKVKIDDDIMDIELLDVSGNTIDKESLSKGEQQLYATALLSALVDESGINFPVFIDSPLQKFDKEHSSNVIQQFYPEISEQVVLFPLLEKELSLQEYDQLKPKLNGVYLIENDSSGSWIEECGISKLFTKFNKESHVLAN